MSQLLEVSLAECLEVKGAALDEVELWAILTQTLERIDALFAEVSTARLNEMLPITPESIFLCPNGQTDLTSSSRNSRFYEDCLPPEFLNDVSFNNDQLEKMFIFSLGMSVYSAADYNLTSEQDLNISSELDEFLSSMCTKNPKNRINFDMALKACSGNFMSVTPILELHRMVLGQTDIEMHPVEEKTYDYSYEVFKSNKISSMSQVPSEASTIHYILLDRGPNVHSSLRSFDTFDGHSKITDKKFEEISVPSEADIEETFLRLNNRRRRLESLRKGLRKLENDDLSEASMNFARLSNLGLLSTNQSTPNLLGTESQQPMNFLSSEYEWLDRRAREIDDWRRNHLKSKEVIIAPDPIIREADIHKEHEQPQTSNDIEIRRYIEPELPSERRNHVPNESFENEPAKPDTSKWNISSDAMRDKNYSVKVDEEVQTRAIDPVNKIETDQTKVGPEFRLTYPTVNLTVREASLTSDSNMRHAMVRLLNGSEVDVLCCPTNTGQQLYECVAAFLSLKEPHLFGLAVPKDEELLFLDKELELRKVAPLDWNEKKKFRSRTSSFLLLHFCIQYFIPNTSYLRFSSTLHLFYLQLRQHVLSGRLQINDIPSNFLLAALALRAEYGNRVDAENFSTQDYLPQTMIRKSGEAVCRTSTLSKWRGMSVIPQRDAERIFVEKCMTFKEYGYHFYRVSKADNILSPNNTWIGLGIPGIVVGRDLDESRVLEVLHQWSNTLKVSYNRHRFSISNNNSTKFNYYTDSFRKCRYLLWLVSDQHFFKLVPILPVDRNEAGIINDVVEPKRSLLGKKNGLQKAKIEENQKQEPVINSIDKDFQVPMTSFAQDDQIQLDTQNKLLKHLQERPQIDLPSFDFEDLKNDSNPSQVTFETTQEDLGKPDVYPKSSSKLPAQKFGQEVNMNNEQLTTQNKLLSYVQEKPQIDLPVFKLGDNYNMSDPTPIANESFIEESPVKSERMPNQKISTNNDAVPNISTLETNTEIPKISPIAASKVSNIPRSFNKRPPAKFPRLLKDSQSKSSQSLTLPSVVVNDFSNQSEVGIPSSSGIKMNPLYQDEESSHNDEMDSNKTPVPTLRSSLLKESNATQNPAASQKAEELKERIKLTLERKAPNGYGIGLARERKHEGVFIISLLPGGVADLDGRLAPGDEIKMINGEDVSGSGGYWRAIKLLSQDVANLEVERKMTPLNWSTNEVSSAVPPSNENPSPDLRVSDTLGISEFDKPLEKAESRVSSAMSDTTSLQNYHFGATDAPDSNDSPINSVRNIIGKFESIPQTPTNLNKNNNNESPRMRKHLFLELEGAIETSDKDGNIKTQMSMNDVVFVDEKDVGVEIFPLLPNDLQDIMRAAGETTDLLLLSKFKKTFAGFKNSGAEELKKLINKLETQLNHDQPLVEFKGLAHPRRNDPCVEGSKPDNRLRNRFQNILPFDSSRVVLQPLQSSDGKTSSYINASHIKYQVGRTQFAFIATQAPLVNTIADFWVMIWQNNVKFISMLTKEFENGQNKCYHYWPNHKLIVCNHLEVTLVGSKQLEDFDLKLFHMVNRISFEQRIVCHSTFQNWPHEPRTRDTTAIMKFISLMDHFSGGAPVAVHCSAGIGRTGVLIALKICLEFLRADTKFDLKTIIEDLRKERGGMVQTKQHYQLCCQAILDVFKLILEMSRLPPQTSSGT